MNTRGFDRAKVKGIKADYVKKTMQVVFEVALDDFNEIDRDVLSEWAEMEFTVDVIFSRHVGLGQGSLPGIDA